jgi:hypothetical protein
MKFALELLSMGCSVVAVVLTFVGIRHHVLWNVAKVVAIVAFGLAIASWAS